MISVSSDSEPFRQLCSLWRWVKWELFKMKRQFFKSETIFFLSRSNYIVYAKLESTHWSIAQYAVILDTEVGAIFIMREIYSTTTKVMDQSPYILCSYQINRYSSRKHLCNKRPFRSQVTIVKFYAIDKLWADVTVGCELCGKHAKEIRPRRRVVEIDDGITVCIIRFVVTPKRRSLKRKYMRTKQEDRPTGSLRVRKPDWNPKFRLG